VASSRVIGRTPVTLGFLWLLSKPLEYHRARHAEA
jgi:hypothetical protein